MQMVDMLLVTLLITENFVTFETRHSLPMEHMSLQIIFPSKRLIANWTRKLLVHGDNVSTKEFSSAEDLLAQTAAILWTTIRKDSLFLMPSKISRNAKSCSTITTFKFLVIRVSRPVLKESLLFSKAFTTKITAEQLGFMTNINCNFPWFTTMYLLLVSQKQFFATKHIFTQVA